MIRFPETESIDLMITCSGNIERPIHIFSGPDQTALLHIGIEEAVIPISDDVTAIVQIENDDPVRCSHTCRNIILDHDRYLQFQISIINRKFGLRA